MKKKRLKEPYDFIWEDEEGMLHVCDKKNCEDGCECEKSMMSKDFLAEFVKRYIKDEIHD